MYPFYDLEILLLGIVREMKKKRDLYSIVLSSFLITAKNTGTRPVFSNRRGINYEIVIK